MNSPLRESLQDTSALSRAILRTVLYFDVFRFPLKKEEIRSFLSDPRDPEAELENLVQEGLLQEKDGYFGTGDLAEKIHRRQKGEQEARRYMKSARRISRALSAIPFIRCVCISGSLSKGYMDEDSDIDYFLVVRENRLWIVRAIFSFLILGFGAFKIKKYLCPNYIMVDSNLEVRDRNIFTATEISSLIPMYNQTVYEHFLEQNGWVRDFLPHARKGQAEYHKERKHRLDFFWQSNACGRIDDFFFSLYQWHYGRKFRNLERWNLTRTDVNFKKNLYKMHNTGHRSRILDAYKEKIETFNREFRFDLTTHD